MGDFPDFDFEMDFNLKFDYIMDDDYYLPKISGMYVVKLMVFIFQDCSLLLS